MRRLKFLLVLAALGPVLSRGQDPVPFRAPEARIAEVARSPEWLRLLHYRSPFLRGARSDVDTREFFLAPDGARDPEAELRATLAMLLDPARARSTGGDPIGQAVACAYPARRDFLARAFGATVADRFARVPCPDFDVWAERIGAKAATLVFSSAYPSNPASMFGHTFLRLDRDASGETSPLRSYSVDFAAQVGPDENPFKYALWGLAGGYTGRFDLSPYYRKVNEYAYSESRDLWEYRLSLTESDVAQLVRHVWELYARAGFDYFFLDENCSFRILTLLEAVRPDWTLSRGFVLSAIPVETVKKALAQPGAVTSIGYRPSLRNQMAAELDRLAPDERARVRKAFVDGALPEGMTTSELDALIAASTYEKARQGGKLEPARAALLRSSLVARSSRGKSGSAEVPEPVRERPHLSHGSSLLFASGAAKRGAPRSAGFGVYGFRHDLLDRVPSFNRFSELRVLGFRFSDRSGSPVRLEEFDGLALTSLAPRTTFDPQTSWEVSFGWGRASDSIRPSAGAWRISGGYGAGAELGSRDSLVWAMPYGELAKSGAYAHGARLSVGPDLGAAIALVAERWFARVRALPLWDAWGALGGRRWSGRAELEQAVWISSEWDVRLLGRLEWPALGDVGRPVPGVEVRLGLRF